ATSVAASAVHFTRDGVSIDTAVPLQAFAVAGAVAAGLGAPYLPVRGLYIAFAVMLLYAAWRAWPRPQRAATTLQPHPLVGRAGAGAGGVVASLLGVGGGIVFTPLLHVALGLDFHRAAATSVYLIGLTAASGALVYLVRGDVAMPLVGPTMLGVLIGATLASAGARRVSASWLGRVFAVLLIYVAGRMLMRGLSGA
ncbi:MAG: sulfite exporter TauE/SafE family protein, partial [Gemmatimonadota bacterium]|nr:sulfite exporter TauE/SafE family protein [Gemmatimonadota bacterium]